MNGWKQMSEIVKPSYEMSPSASINYDMIFWVGRPVLRQVCQTCLLYPVSY
jgi:hypothetical protein